MVRFAVTLFTHCKLAALSGAYCFPIGFRPTLVAYERPARLVAINIGMFVQERTQARSLTFTICCATCCRQPVSKDREVEEVAMCQNECDTAHFSLEWLYRRALPSVACDSMKAAIHKPEYPGSSTYLECCVVQKSNCIPNCST